MSLSKEHLLVANAEKPRRPKCTRCRHHGIIVPQKGHMKFCPFLKCDCWKCYLITQRTRITVLQRNLKKDQNKEQGSCALTRSSVVKPATEETPHGGARPSAASGPPSALAPEPAATTAWSPLDLRSRSAAGGECVAGLDSGTVLPFASNAPYIGDFGQTAPLPVIHFPFRMSGHYPSGYAPCPNLLFNMPWLPPLPAGLYNDGLCGPLMFPHFRPGGLHHPPPPEPALLADPRQVFSTLPEPFQGERMSRQPPSFKHTEQDIQQLD